MTKLILLRGLPGSGKSTLGAMLGVSIAADDFFMAGDAGYQFDPAKLPQAHAWCLEEAEILLRRNANNDVAVVVCNTFTQRWELEPYLKLAEALEVRVSVINLYDGGCTDEQLFKRNVHGVPLPAFEAMRARYEHDWKNGDTRPPWER